MSRARLSRDQKQILRAGQHEFGDFQWMQNLPLVYSVRYQYTSMETPFEIPHSILEEGPDARHTRLLRPYVDRLIQRDTQQPVHSNPFNRFNVTRDEIREETLEYWISDDEEENRGNDDSDLSDSDDEHLSLSQKRKRQRSKKKKEKNRLGSLAEMKKTHDAQISHLQGTEKYELNSREIVHIKQQMYLSLQQKSKGSIPSEVSAKDINNALTALSGFETPIPTTYFKSLNQDSSSRSFEKVSSLKYTSRILDNLFYIALFKEDWNQCYKLFSILIRTFKIDIHQIWSLGIYMLNELNMFEFKKFFNVEWIKSNDDIPIPQLSPKLLYELAYLQNSALVPLLVKKFNLNDTATIRTLQRTVSQKRPTYDIIIKFLKLLMRTSRNQHPLSGAYPEQTYVPGGVIVQDEEEEEETGEETAVEDNVETNDENTQARTTLVANSISDLESEQPEAESDSNSNSESDEDADSEEVISDPGSEETTPDTELTQLTTVKKKQQPIVIKNKDFHPGLKNHLPYQHRYMKSLKRHSAPLHRLGTRTRTPTFTLTYIWILVRTGKLSIVQRALEPLLLVVPTSIDARVELANLTSRILDVSCLVKELNESRGAHDWEKVSNIENKMTEIDDCWNLWKEQFTSVSKKRKNKRRKDVKQFENYENVETSLQNLRLWINKSITKNKNQTIEDNNDNSKDNDDPESASDTFHTANEEDEENEIVNDDDEEEEEEEEEKGDAFLFDDEDEAEIEREMARLLGQAEEDYEEEQRQRQQEAEKDENSETENELHNMLQQAQEMYSDDDNFNQEEEEFNSQYNINTQNNYSDSE